MGCDIHIIGEKRYVWERDGESRPDKWEVFRVPDRFRNRYYGFFAHLAGVRNNFDVQPISEPRGLPDDISPTALRWYNLYENEREREGDLIRELFGCSPGEHSTSWLTLEELNKHVWDQHVRQSGIISKEEFLDWDGVSAPTSYCAARSGGGTKILYLDNDPNKHGWKFGDAATCFEEATHFQVDWVETVVSQEYVEDFLTALRNERKYACEEIRIIFNFDS